MKIVERLNKDFKSGAVTIAFLGDSVTNGAFESGSKKMHSAFDFEAVYHNRFKKMLSVLFPTVPVNIINAGIGGDNAKMGLARMDRDVLSKNPDLTVVCFGLNDVNGSLENYLNPLDKIFKNLKEREIETIFMTPNMLNTYVAPQCEESLKEYAAKTADFQTNGKMDLHISSAKDLAKSHNILVADCYAKWQEMYKAGVDTTQLLANLINHPIREMHNLFAYELVNTLFK